MSDLIPLLNAGLHLDVAKIIRTLRREAFADKYVTPLENKFEIIWWVNYNYRWTYKKLVCKGLMSFYKSHTETWNSIKERIRQKRDDWWPTIAT